MPFLSSKCILRVVQVLGVIGCLILAISIYQLNNSEITSNTNRNIRKTSQPLALAGINSESKQSDLVVRNLEEEDDDEEEGGGDESGEEDDEAEAEGEKVGDTNDAESDDEGAEEEDDADDEKSETIDEPKLLGKSQGGGKEKNDEEDDDDDGDDDEKTDDALDAVEVKDNKDDVDTEEDEEEDDVDSQAGEGSDDAEEDDGEEDESEEKDVETKVLGASKDDTQDETKDDNEDDTEDSDEEISSPDRLGLNLEKEQPLDTTASPLDPTESTESPTNETVTQKSKLGLDLGGLSGKKAAPQSNSDSQPQSGGPLGGLTNINVANANPEDGPDSGLVNLNALQAGPTGDLVKTNALELGEGGENKQFKLAQADVWSFDEIPVEESSMPKVDQNITFHDDIEIEEKEVVHDCPPYRKHTDPHIEKSYHKLVSRYLYCTQYDPEYSDVIKVYINRNTDGLPTHEPCYDPIANETHKYLEDLFGNHSALDSVYFDDLISEYYAAHYYIPEVECSDIQTARRFCDLSLAKYFALINSDITLHPKTDVGAKHWFQPSVPSEYLKRLYYTKQMDCLHKCLKKKHALYYEDVEFHIKATSQGEESPSHARIREICKPEPKATNCSLTNYYSFDGKCYKPDGSSFDKPLASLGRMALTQMCPLNDEHITMPSSRDVSLFLGYISYLEHDACNDTSFCSSNLFALFLFEHCLHDMFETRTEGLSYLSHEGLRSCTRSGGQIDPLLKNTCSAPIYVSRNDPVYEKHHVQCLNFNKIQRVNLDCTLTKADPASFQSPQSDLSNLYSGKTQIGQHGQIAENFGFPMFNSQNAYQSAPALALSMLYAKLHNFFALIIHTAYPNKSDHEIFYVAQKLNIIFYQHLFIWKLSSNVLGEAYVNFQNIKNYTNCYKSDIEAVTLSEFVCATRTLHRLLPPHIVLNKGGNVNYVKYFNSSYGHPEEVQQDFTPYMETFFRDQVNSCGIGSHLQSDLFQFDHSYGLDLIAMDNQRCRDLCVRPYVYYLKLFFKVNVTTWDDLKDFMEPFALKKLEQLYYHPGNLELYPGLCAEKKIKHTFLGRLGLKILAEGIVRTKCSDPFFYTNYLSEDVMELVKQMNYELLMHLVTEAKVTKDILLPHLVQQNDYASYTDEEKINLIRLIKTIAHELQKH